MVQFPGEAEINVRLTTPHFWRSAGRAQGAEIWLFESPGIADPSPGLISRALHPHSFTDCDYASSEGALLGCVSHEMRRYPHNYRTTITMVMKKGASRLRVLVAVKRPLIRAGLERWIATALPHAEIFHASSGEESVAQFSLHEPGVVLAEPEIALELKERLRGGCAPSRLLLISAREHAGLAQLPGLTCACGHLSDGASEAQLIDAIKLSAGCEHPDRSACGNCPCALKSTLVPIATGLSRRQAEVFVLISEGHQPKEIARRLSISVKTVESCRGQIKEKLGLSDSRALLQFAVIWRRDSGTTPKMFLNQLADSHLEAKSPAESGRSK